MSELILILFCILFYISWFISLFIILAEKLKIVNLYKGELLETDRKFCVKLYKNVCKIVFFDFFLSYDFFYQSSRLQSFVQ